MKTIFSIGIYLSLFTIGYTVQSQSLQELEKNRVMLPNGWSITPVGDQVPVGDLPLNLVVSHNKQFLAVTNNGQSTQTIDLVELPSGKRTDSIIISKSFYGLAFSRNDRFIYASGGNDNRINKYEIIHKKLKLVDSLVIGKPWPNKISPTGIELEETKLNNLFVVTKENSSLYVFDLTSKKILNKVSLGAEAYACRISKDLKTLFISAWGRGKVLLYDIAGNTIRAEISVGSNPNELHLSKDGRWLYVANANDNSVSVISVATEKVIETLNAALYPNSPSGSTTNGVALSEDQKTLYIANADNNCLAVFDVSVPGRSKSRGFIPVGWFPTNVKVSGKKIYVTNGKGLSSFANPDGPDPTNKRQVVIDHQGDSLKPKKVQYIGGLFRGTLSIIKEPNTLQLGAYTSAVYRNSPYSKERELVTEGEAGNPVPMKVGDKSPIKYVFYIIKENRTYDQVLSDIPGGNGDTSLLLFGEKITPNQHKIAKEFVLLDNFYVDAEVSADGHNWSMGAYATDYNEKTWPTAYGQRGGGGESLGLRAISNNRDGYIWDHCARNNITYRTYGGFVKRDLEPNLPVLEGHVAPFMANDARYRDTMRINQWKRDFDSLVAVNALPRLSTLRLSNDHTEGMRLGRPTPYAHVADNDLAVGMMVEHLSRSPVWKESAVFILEDDAQNGPDHVDAHRSTAYVISPYVKRRSVDHTMYTTSGMLRTMELILGLPPMTQYDAAATPMWRCFNATPDFTPFNSLPSNVDLNEVNKKNDDLAKRSEQFDWTKIDAVPDLLFNEILWQGLKGRPAPSPVRAGFLKATK